MRRKRKSRLAAVELLGVLTATAALFIKAQSVALASRDYHAIGGEFILLFTIAPSGRLSSRQSMTATGYSPLLPSVAERTV